jgi:biotin synthase
MNPPLTLKDILAWLREEDPDRLATLWAWANETRHLHVGDSIHLRGLVEISSRCIRQCAYCGLRVSNRSLTRYRMSPDEILVSARQAVAYGYGTVVGLAASGSRK